MQRFWAKKCRRDHLRSLWRSVGGSVVQLLKEDGEVWPSVGLRSLWRSIEGLCSKTLQLLEYGYWNYFSELHDEPAGRTVKATTDCHKLRNPTLSQTSPSSLSSCTMLPPTDRHKLRRWSLLHFFAQNLRIQLWTDFLQNQEKLI